MSRRPPPPTHGSATDTLRFVGYNFRRCGFLVHHAEKSVFYYTLLICMSRNFLYNYANGNSESFGKLKSNNV